MSNRFLGSDGWEDLKFYLDTLDHDTKRVLLKELEASPSLKTARDAVFSLPELQPWVDKEVREMFYTQFPPRDEKGATCRRCKGNNTVTIQMQTRAGDEAMTTFISCHDCLFVDRN